MNKKEKLIKLILDSLEHTDYSCEICNKLGYKCSLNIPDDFDFNDAHKIDFSKCNFREQVYKTLTTEQ